MEKELAYTATDDARDAIASIGRTEDVTFSPDDRRLAIAGYFRNACLFLDVEIDFSRGQKRIALSDPVVVTSPEFKEPHGIAFLDSKIIVVANRTGRVRAFKVPARVSEGGQRSVEIEPERIDNDAGMHTIASPGSLAVVPRGKRRYDILVCRNFPKKITRHRLEANGELRVMKNQVLLGRGLRIPDGVAVSPSGRWIAISSHKKGSILLYRNTWFLNRFSTPTGVLRGIACPHGVRFTPDGRHVLVAHAGAPLVSIYTAEDDNWRGTRDPAKTLQVMDEETFARGQVNPEEGGPKGIDIDRDMNVLVVTSDQQRLAFFDLRAALAA